MGKLLAICLAMVVLATLIFQPALMGPPRNKPSDAGDEAGNA
jgi:hypothetical protein